MELKKECPKGVKVISICFYLLAAITLIFSIPSFLLYAEGTTNFFTGSVANFLSETLYLEILLIVISSFFSVLYGYIYINSGGILFNGILTLGGIFVLATYIFVARGLKRGKNWARIITIIISSLSLFSGFIAIEEVIEDKILFIPFFIGIIANIIIINYLLFRKEVKNFFSANIK